tara:strand:- start:1094 stop:1537 length:444 start_codon:yes stop_codon:yes gene_type:complete
MTLKTSPYQIQPGHLGIHTARQSAPYRSLTIFIFLASFAALALGSFSPSPASQSQQHSWVGDVPIMADLSVEPALGFAFDSPNGRIVMIFASSTANAADVLEFYNVSLAAIGWVGGHGEWRRGPETLLISEVSTSAGRLWRLMVRPN